MEMRECGSQRKMVWERWFRRDNLLIIILSGILIFIIALPAEEKGSGAQSAQSSNGQTQNTGTNRNDETESAEIAQDLQATDLEERLESLLSEMAGVGKVKVMITLESSEELVVEKDDAMVRSNTNENDSAGGSRMINQVDTAPTTVYRTEGGESEPYVVKTISPRVEGVVVVAQGGGNGTVNKNITEMVQALFGVEAHKVKVVKMAQ